MRAVLSHPLIEVAKVVGARVRAPMWSAAVQGVVQEPRVWGGAAHAVQSLQESGLTEVWGGAAHAARSSPVVKPATECISIIPEVSSEWCAIACGLSAATCPREQCCCGDSCGPRPGSCGTFWKLRGWSPLLW